MQKDNSITQGNITRALLVFFFPLLFGNAFQQLYNTVDAMVVGRFVGHKALAAVGGGAAVYVNLLVGFFVGLTSGAGVIISQFAGARNSRELSRSVHTALLMSLGGGIIITALGMIFAGPILRLTNTPDEVFADSLLYLRVFFCGLVPMFMYNMAAAVMRANGDSRTPLYILIVACISNIILDILFVIVLKLGVFGVALATDICQVESATVSLILLHKRKDDTAFRFRNLAVTPHLLGGMLRIGFPAGIQSSLYTVSNLIIQKNINSFGTAAIASWAAYGKLDAVFWTTVSTLGLAVTTFAGQNYGAGKYDRVKKGMWQTLLMGAAATIVYSLVFYFFGSKIMLLFTDDAEVLQIGEKLMHFLVPVWITYISIEVLSGTIRGCGSSFIPTMITVFGVCVLRILWIVLAVPHHNTLLMVLACYPITWTATSTAFWIYYAGGKWLKVR